MKIKSIEIYQLDEWNWTYRLYRKNKESHLTKKEYAWKESKNYFGNLKKCIEWCRQVLVDDVLSEAIDFEDAMDKLDKLQEKIDCIINVKKWIKLF